MNAARSIVYARHGMVASAHPLATRIGTDILASGGSAIDAAIAANAALGFLEPMSCGIGGDLFAIIWDPKTQRIYGLNASGRAPRAIVPARIPAGPDGEMLPRTPYTWTVPGAVDGWVELHRRFGRRPLSEVLAPAIQAADAGAPVPRVIAAAWERESLPVHHLPGFAATFLPGGRPPREGEIFRNAALARTYRAIAERGRAGFHEGPVAAAIDAFSRQVGGYLNEEDLSLHRSEWVEPICTSYRGTELWELPPNSQGITALQMLNILKALDLRGCSRDTPDFWHELVEVKKLAFEDRARFIADPAFARDPTAYLLSWDHARELAARVDMTTAAQGQQPYHPRLRVGDTTVVAAADEEGAMISLLQSNYEDFGSGYVVEECGFALQNRGAQFDLRPGRANSLAPGKRPFHTLMPALVTRDGQPWIAFGLMGGDMQPQGHVQVLVNLLDCGMDLQEAGDAPRCYHTDSAEPTGLVTMGGGTLALEPGISEDIRRELVRRGHRVREAATHAFGGYQAVARSPTTGVFAGATESRKDGCAMGY
ncbi:gamma-glutamyltransferase family protein [Archangium violaceum]|uniref:gamma-glutamyltransferase family protein n=1 Tax=Archangium violaceum TaxID=83451 RepID=UPI00193BFF49|nr:gamma-glutamyltransferase family protein [Archangium violaceum]QRK10108.1 gamma-glutamyltransferase family protein [Archangium violaceum]